MPEDPFLIHARLLMILFINVTLSYTNAVKTDHKCRFHMIYEWSMHAPCLVGMHAYVNDFMDDHIHWSMGNDPSMTHAMIFMHDPFTSYTSNTSAWLKCMTQSHYSKCMIHAKSDCKSGSSHDSIKFALKYQWSIIDPNCLMNLAPQSYHAWSMLDPGMIYARFMLDPCMIHAWSMHDPCMIHTWYIHDPCMIHAWSIKSSCGASYIL